VAPVSTVAIPFKDEDPNLVLANVAVAAGNSNIDRVWAVGESEEVSYGAAGIASATGTSIEVIPDSRIGIYRAGKGDAMNTALRRAAAEGVDRLHFYDADITNFDDGWIGGAEAAADLGYRAVRHTFPRAATDAMITWFVTKPMLAMKYPGTILPKIGQPLGGELMLVGDAIETVASAPGVSARSDWGIDTLLTHAMVDTGLSLYEHHVSAGKSHSLYGSLDELKTMLVECFDAVRSLPDHPPPAIEHARDPESPAPQSLRSQTGYSVNRTRPLLAGSLAPGEANLIASLPGALPAQIDRMMSTGDVGYLDEDVWWEVLLSICEEFTLGDPARESLRFRLWTGRVLNYTDTHVSRGYSAALEYLAGTIRLYQL
jgi:mannosylglycerate synthase